MNELIPINYSGEEPTVSARDLHAGLEITDNFLIIYAEIRQEKRREQIKTC